MKLYKVLLKTTFLSFLAFAFLFVSCKKDDPDPVVVVDNNEIVGKWQLTSVTPENASTSIPGLSLIPVAAPCAYSLIFTFTSDNKVTPSNCDAAIALLAQTGYITVGQTTTWKVANGNLNLTNGSTVQALPIKQNVDEMTITVNTNTTGAGAAVNALLLFKRVK